MQASKATRAPEDTILSRGKEVVHIEATALFDLAASLDANFIKACQTILATKGRVVVTGMGKSGHIARKTAATFAATATPAQFVHPAEASHGDLGMISRGDTLLILSNSGNTSELRDIMAYARNIGVPIIGIASRPDSFVMTSADIALPLPPSREACPANVAPTTSTTLQLAMGDALAMAVMDLRGVEREDLYRLHPGGAIGLRLTPVSDIMHGPDRMPLVQADAAIPDVISIMTSGGFGIAGVTDASDTIIGVITDGDLRRHFARLGTAKASEIMSRDPKMLYGAMPAEEALLFMNDAKISAAFVIGSGNKNPTGKILGVVHIHDFVRLGFD